MSKNVQDADIYIIDPKGIKYMKEHFPETDPDILYIYASPEVRQERATKRESELQKFLDREMSEDEQFTEFEENQTKYGYTRINNIGIPKEKLMEQIEQILGLSQAEGEVKIN